MALHYAINATYPGRAGLAWQNLPPQEAWIIIQQLLRDEYSFTVLVKGRPVEKYSPPR